MSAIATIENLLSQERAGYLYPSPWGRINLQTHINVSNYMWKWVQEHHCSSAIFFQAINIFYAYMDAVDTNDVDCVELKDDGIPTDIIHICLIISSKKISIFPMDYSDFYEDDVLARIINLEVKILEAINYNIAFPNIMDYLKCFKFSRDDMCVYAKLLAIYSHHVNVSFLPSVVATTVAKMATELFNIGGEYSNPFSVPNEVVMACCYDISNTLFHRDCYEKEFKSILAGSEKFDSGEFIRVIEKYCNTKPMKSFDGKRLSFSNYKIESYMCNAKRLEICHIDDFIVSKKLGSGTYGSVVKATKDGKDYAIKITNANLGDDIQPSFLREVSLLSVMEHKNIVKMYSCLENAEGIVLELMDSDINTFAKKNRAEMKSFVLQEKITKDLLEGLVYMHSNGILNRDIKPYNILVRGKWSENNPEALEIKFCDFGLGKGNLITSHDIRHTSVVCTLWYRPIELLMGEEKYGDKVDIWSLACTIYEVCTGSVLFESDCEIDHIRRIIETLGYTSELDVYKNHKLNRDLPHNTSIIDDNKIISPKIKEIIKKGLIYSPTARPSASLLLYKFNLCAKPVSPLQIPNSFNTTNPQIRKSRGQTTHWRKVVM